MVHYKIKKGEHYSKPKSLFPFVFRPRKMLKSVCFSPKCLYNPYEEGDHWNKLFGISLGLDHHSNSIRIGWRPSKELFYQRIELCLYVYCQGYRIISPISFHADVSVSNFISFSLLGDDKIKVEVISRGSKFSTVFENIHLGNKLSFDNKIPFGYKLYPYYGGEPTALNDMDIWIDKFKLSKMEKVKSKVAKTVGSTDASEGAKTVKDTQFFGNVDTFKLLCKASSQSEGWMKSTKAMEIKSIGCVVQVTTQQGDNVSEALTFVPGARIIETLDAEGKVIGRLLSK